MADQDDEMLDSKKGAEGGEDGIEDDDGQEDLDSLALGDDQEDIETLKENNRKLFARAKHAEGFVKDKEGNWVKKTKPAATEPKKPADGEQQHKPSSDSDPYEKDELRLIARAFSDEEIAKAKVIAKGSGVSLLEAIKDPLFLAFQENFKKEEKKENARLGASHGSGSHESKPKFASGMTRDEHKAAWEETAAK